MNRVWDDVTQVQQIERALVRDDGNVFPDSEPRSEHVLAGRRWIFTQAIESMANADEPSALGVVREQGSTEAAPMGLLSGEVAGLSRDHMKQAHSVRPLGHAGRPFDNHHVIHTPNIT
jgi:hypothetical protein